MTAVLTDNGSGFTRTVIDAQRFRGVRYVVLVFQVTDQGSSSGKSIKPIRKIHIYMQLFI